MATAILQARSGAMGSIDLSWSLHKEVPSYVRIYGARGTIEVGWKVSRYKLENDRAMDKGAEEELAGAITAFKKSFA